ncbi:MAG: TQO small subunit DoxD [Candidatus Ranarchaeia archaeon]|jgi:thiosulfate dehydrogenase [quinone] large subunit
MATKFSNSQWMVLITTVALDLLMVALYVLAIIPAFIVDGDTLAIYLSWLLGASLVAIPTTLMLKIGWPEKITTQTLLLPLRLGFAYLFLHGGIAKLLDPTYLASPGLIAAGMFGAPSVWIQSVMAFLNTNYAFYLLLIAVGEVLIGLSMLTGTFTRLGAIGGILMQLVFLFLLGWLSASTFSANLLGPLAFVLIGTHRAGRTIGIDGWWAKKLENSPSPIPRFLGWFT